MACRGCGGVVYAQAARVNIPTGRRFKASLRSRTAAGQQVEETAVPAPAESSESSGSGSTEEVSSEEKTTEGVLSEESVTV